ncbi:uncharacterized protein LOC133305952 isoform X1 [Gastrolobium bilobum]|uniref:uncharacterized protein LOC133305952 isoform X1 n=1 Tax=Gastrolobium bilobum TaxID=150636 RepID=UPI002AAF5CD4|nr:uncharacterized protein LOC133305952 isoform X1 [Gastrolobium bilobum]
MSPMEASAVSSETTVALLRHRDYFISAYSSVDIKQSFEDMETCFLQLSMEEQAKSDVNNIKKQSTRSQSVNESSNEYVVGEVPWAHFLCQKSQIFTRGNCLPTRITIFAIAKGEHKLPSINGSGDLKEALLKLGSIPSSKLLGGGVLGNPQNENDTLSEQKLLEDYPHLRPL